MMIEVSWQTIYEEPTSDYRAYNKGDKPYEEDGHNQNEVSYKLLQ